jgi:GNAT superfamily N-acetyltransferase
MSLTIRPATIDDLEALHETAERAVFKLLSEHYSAEQLNAARDGEIYKVERELVESGRYYAVEIDGVVVGGSGWSDGGEFGPAGHVDSDVRADASTATMRATYIDPDWSRHGLATLLARVTETVARNADFRVFEAMCTPASEAFREAMGYSLVERVPTKFSGGVELLGARMRKVC